jgi:hypothetical protein
MFERLENPKLHFLALEMWLVKHLNGLILVTFDLSLVLRTWARYRQVEDAREPM